MTINSTLLIQAVNFFIAYLMLRFLLFKPVVASIQQEDGVRQKLLDTLASKKQHNDHARQMQRNQWQEYELYFEQQRPVIGSIRMREQFPEIRELEPLSTDEIKDCAQQISTTMISKVDHVH